jgi:hypothetical protein
MAFASIRSRTCFALLAQLTVLFSCRNGLSCDSASCSCHGSCSIDCTHQGAWFIADSPNFQVCSLQSSAQAEQLAKHCEDVRATIAQAWCKGCEAWNPKCQIVLHQTTRDYVRAAGPGSAATLGSSLVKPAVGAIRTRRIDLRTNVDDYLTAALPHELCHVVLADRFRERRAPLWFDEGVALQYDSPAKQRLHERDLRMGLEQGVAFPLAELVTMEGYPTADRWGVFYGQSAALVRHLLAQGTPQQLLASVEQAPIGGMSLALRNDFHLRSWSGVQMPSALSKSAGRDSAIRLVSVTEAPAHTSNNADGW